MATRSTTPDRPPADSAAADWLASTHPRPERALREWKRGQLAAFTIGHYWDVVTVPAGGTNPGAERERLIGVGITGPVVHAPRTSAYYLLVPPGTAEWWRVAGCECVGRDEYIRQLGLPAPDRTEPPGGYWLIPPDGSTLVDPERLHRVLVTRTRIETAGDDEQ